MEVRGGDPVYCLGSADTSNKPGTKSVLDYGLCDSDSIHKIFITNGISIYVQQYNQYYKKGQ